MVVNAVVFVVVAVAVAVVVVVVIVLVVVAFLIDAAFKSSKMEAKAVHNVQVLCNYSPAPTSNSLTGVHNQYFVSKVLKLTERPLSLETISWLF